MLKLKQHQKITHFSSFSGLQSFLDVVEKQCDTAATANSDTPRTHSKHTTPSWTYGIMLNSRFNSTIRPGVSLSMPISIHIIGKTILSYGFKRLLNFVSPSSKLSCKRECTFIGTPNCCVKHKKNLLKSWAQFCLSLFHLRVVERFRIYAFLHLVQDHQLH